MKKVSVGELRQNPAAMVADLEAGETYELTKHNRRIGLIVPELPSAVLVPPRRIGDPHTRDLPVHTLRTASSIEELLDEEKGEW